MGRRYVDLLPPTWGQFLEVDFAAPRELVEQVVTAVQQQIRELGQVADMATSMDTTQLLFKTFRGGRPTPFTIRS